MTNSYVFVFCIAIIATAVIGQSTNIDYDGAVSIHLYHALNDDVEATFTERGNVSINSLRVGNAIVTNKELTDDELLKLKSLIKNGQSYRMKAVVTNIDGSVTELLTFVKACMLGNSNLVDKLTVSLDFAGIVIGVHLSVPDALLCETSDEMITQNPFRTSVYIQHTEQGPVPDTASYIQKIERERESREKGETKDNRSFLAKYWIYIVPALIFMVISSAVNPEGGAGGAAAGGR